MSSSVPVVSVSRRRVGVVRVATGFLTVIKGDQNLIETRTASGSVLTLQQSSSRGSLLWPQLLCLRIDVAVDVDMAATKKKRSRWWQKVGVQRHLRN